MPKISIYVPDEMKARMDETDDRANWSGIAQRAFEVELDHVETVMEIKTMTDVIERLRASKTESAERQAETGRQLGVDWAKRFADYEELRRIAGIDTSNFQVIYSEDTGWESAEWVVEQTIGDAPASADEVAEFYGLENDMLDAVLTTKFVEAFVVGASEVWSEIKDKI